MNPELDSDNPAPEVASEHVDNSEVAASETNSDEVIPGNGTDVSSDGANGSGSFWSGNPLDLEPENLAIYREMQSGLTSKTQEIADLKRGLDEDRSVLQDQRSQLQQTWVKSRMGLTMRGRRLLLPLTNCVSGSPRKLRTEMVLALCLR